MAEKEDGGEKGALICVTRDGPYIVTGSVPLKKETAALAAGGAKGKADAKGAGKGEAQATGRSQTPRM